ncbi:MAG: winged helix DNA-binding domain-containing protein [Tannerella sp.]|jgi:hypothetical protein|nr:winged helix DNA-binding domain-containing protein [Tannerella sp.]
MREEQIRVLSHQLGHSEFKDPEKLVAWMGAIQAQDYGMSKWAIGVRLKSATVGDIEAALDRGCILRTHVMRPTWHLVAAEDIRWMLQLSKEHIKSTSASRDRDLEITEELYFKCNRIITGILEGNNHLTRQEIAFELTKAGIIADTSRMIHFLMRAEIEGIVCSGIDRGNKQTYALLDERVPPAKTIHREEALALLATKYFRSHSPASLQDFVWWSGLSVGNAKQAIHLIRPELLTDHSCDSHLFIHQSCNKEFHSGGLIHFLPAFDEYIIGYKDRTSILAAEHQPEAFSKNGIFHPVIMQNGKIVGVWKKTANKDRINIQSSFFESINSSEDRIILAMNKYKAFIGNFQKETAPPKKN